MAIRFRKPEFQKKLERARRFTREQPKENGTPTRWIGVLIIILLAVIFYFLVISSMFLVDEVVLAETTTDAAQLAEVLKKMRSQRIYLIPSNHMLILNQEKFLAAIQKEMPEVRSITNFRRILPDRLEIALEERQPLYIWQTGEKYFFLDQDGVVFEEVFDYDPASYSQILIVDRAQAPVALDERLSIQNMLNFIEQVKIHWPSLVTQTNFAEFSVPAAKSLDLFLKTGIGFEVYFDLERGARGQLENLALLLNQEIKPETYSGLSYIDLRLPQVAYYCYQDAPCATPPPSPSPGEERGEGRGR